MEAINQSEEYLHERDMACSALNRILGADGVITHQELVASFNSPGKLALLYEPGKSIDEIKEIITTNEHQQGNTTTRPLSSTAIIANGLPAFWQWAKTGFGLATPEQYKARMTACNNCDYYQEPPDLAIYKLAGMLTKCGKICSVCGCMIEKKARIISGKCPAAHAAKAGLSRWEEPLEQ